MRLPAIIINFKNYEQATGKNALKLAKICEKVAKETGKNIAVAVQAVDIYNIAHSVSIPVFAQHIDPIGYGQDTGFILPESVKEAGASGTLINHSEHQIDDEKIKACIKRAKEVGLISLVCADSAERSAVIVKFKPDFVAFEEPKLIGGDISVSEAEPELVKRSIKAIGKNAIVGAGVNCGEDVKISLKMGAVGVLLASKVAKKSKDPEATLRDLVSGIK